MPFQNAASCVENNDWRRLFLAQQVAGQQEMSSCSRYELGLVGLGQNLSAFGTSPNLELVHNHSAAVLDIFSGLKQEACKDGWTYSTEYYQSTVVSEVLLLLLLFWTESMLIFTAFPVSIVDSPTLSCPLCHGLDRTLRCCDVYVVGNHWLWETPATNWTWLDWCLLHVNHLQGVFALLSSSCCDFDAVTFWLYYLCKLRSPELFLTRECCGSVVASLGWCCAWDRIHPLITGLEMQVHLTRVKPPI